MARGCKICFIVSTLFFIIVSIIIVTLILTLFRPKDPFISLHFGDFDFLSPILTKNVTLGMVITMSNPNYGNFMYPNSIGYINYHDMVVGRVPIETKLVPAHSQINVSTYADFKVGMLMKDPRFWKDVVPEMTFDLTSSAELPGKVIILKYVKLKATVYTVCDISVNIKSNSIESNCISRIKLTKLV